MQYLAIKREKNPLLKINCWKCWKKLEDWAIICWNNKQRSPSAFFCKDCLSTNMLSVVKEKFKDPTASIKYLM